MPGGYQWTVVAGTKGVADIAAKGKVISFLMINVSQLIKEIYMALDGG